MKKLIDKLRDTFIKVALSAADGNITKAGKALGMNRTTLLWNIDKYAINVDKYLPAKSVYRKHDKKPKEIDDLVINPPGVGRGSDRFKVEKMKYIYSALVENGFNRSHAAKSSGLSVRCIRYYIDILRYQGYDVPDSPFQGKREKKEKSEPEKKPLPEFLVGVFD